MSRSGSHLVCASEHRIHIIDLETHAESSVGRVEAAVMACCLSADGHHLLCTTANQNRVCLAMWCAALQPTHAQALPAAPDLAYARCPCPRPGPCPRPRLPSPHQPTPGPALSRHN